MLSRFANHMYWMQRYRERAENIARLLEVNFILNMDMPNKLMQWEPVLKTTGSEKQFKALKLPVTRDNVLKFLTINEDNPGSIISSLFMARENARAIRAMLPRELWQELNTTYLFVQKQATTKMLTEEPHGFFSRIIRQCQVCTGISESTMSHDKAWHFGRMGYLLERADKTSRILDVKYYILLPSAADVGSPLDNVQWGALLRSASALVMYRQRWRQIDHEHVIDFLVLDKRFPRAIYSCLSRLEDSLQAVIGSSDNKRAEEVSVLLKTLLSELRATDHDGIVREGLHEFLDRIQCQCIDINNGIHAAFFDLGDPGE